MRTMTILLCVLFVGCAGLTDFGLASQHKVRWGEIAGLIVSRINRRRRQSRNMSPREIMRSGSIFMTEGAISTRAIGKS